jgi:hypothetical protein
LSHRRRRVAEDDSRVGRVAAALRREVGTATALRREVAPAAADAFTTAAYQCGSADEVLRLAMITVDVS